MIELRLLEYCLHPNSNLEFAATPSTFQIERLPPERDECTVFPGYNEFLLLTAAFAIFGVKIEG
jgi:hypothetical protein